MLRHREFDVAEMSLSSYVVSLFAHDPPFIAIPVFPSRFFRHSCIYVNADAGITRTGRSGRQARRHAGIPDDRAGLDPRHPLRRLRRAGRRRPATCTGGVEGAGPARKRSGARPAVPHPASRAIDPDADALGDARNRRDRRASTRRARHRTFRDRRRPRPSPLRGLRAMSNATTSADTRIFPDHAHRRDPARRLRAPPLDRAIALQGVRRAPRRDAYDDLCVRPPRSRPCCRGSRPAWRTRAARWETTSGPTAWRETADVLTTFLRYSHEQGLSRRQLSLEEAVRAGNAGIVQDLRSPAASGLSTSM